MDRIQEFQIAQALIMAAQVIALSIIAASKSNVTTSINVATVHSYLGCISKRGTW